MGTYEVLFILSPRLAEEEVTSTISEFKGVAENSGMTLVNEDPWGKRRLAYPIEKMNEGVYHLFVFEGEGDGLREVDRRMKNSDRIMRHMIVRTDLETMRAKKLAIKNPPKPRIRPEARTKVEETAAPLVQRAAAVPAETTATEPAEKTAAPEAEKTAPAGSSETSGAES